MWINRYGSFFLSVILCCAVFSLSSAQQNSSRKNRKEISETRSISKKAENTGKKAVVYDRRLFDPTIPKLTKQYVNTMFAGINSKLLSYNWPSTLKQAKHQVPVEKEEEQDKKVVKEPQGKQMTSAILKNHLFVYKRMTMHPDLEEVTKTKREYFKMIGRVLLEYVSPISDLQHAVEADNAQAYENALQRIEDASDKLDKLFREQKKYQLTPQELRKIKADNIARRKVEIEKLMKKLGVDKNGKPLKNRQGQTSR